MTAPVNPARTRVVEHILQNPGTGRPVCGKTLSIRLNTSAYINGGAVEKIRTAYVTTALATDPVPGKFSIALEVNDDVLPAGSFYTIQIFGEIQTFIVLPGAGPVNLFDCLTFPPANLPPPILLSMLSIVDNGDQSVTLTTSVGGSVSITDNGDLTATLVAA